MKQWLVLVFLGVSLAAAAEDCLKLKQYVKTACSYPSLKITSSPKNLVVNKDNCDEEFNKGEWQDQPKVTYETAKSDKTYAILSIDPDAPNHDGGQYYLHWIMFNIPGADLIKGDLSKGVNIERYKGPGPPKGTGKHRYLFLLFEQQQQQQNVTRPEQRRKFELVPWLQQQNPELCGPIAANQFLAQF